MVFSVVGEYPIYQRKGVIVGGILINSSGWLEHANRVMVNDRSYLLANPFYFQRQKGWKSEIRCRQYLIWWNGRERPYRRHTNLQSNLSLNRVGLMHKHPPPLKVLPIDIPNCPSERGQKITGVKIRGADAPHHAIIKIIISQQVVLCGVICLLLQIN